MQRKLNERAMGTIGMMTKVINETGAYVLLTRATKDFEGAELAENEEIVPSYSMSY
jgi:hypothetical protein